MAILNILLDLQFLFLLSLFFTDYSFFFKKGVTSLSIQTVIFGFFLILRWFLDRKSFYQLLVVKVYKKVCGFTDNKILFYIVILFILLFSLLGLSSHFSFNTSGIDMGGMDNALWNLAHGNSFISSVEGNINYFGIHFWPIVYLIVPFYLVCPNGLVLIFLQVLAGAIAIFPIYFIAKDRLKERMLIFAFVFSYFICRALRGIISNDFHTDSFLIPLSLFAYYFLSQKKNFAAIICFLLMLMCKENAAFLLAGFGLFLIIFYKRYIFGAGLIIVSIFWWVIATNIIIPHFDNSHKFWGLRWLPYGQTYSQNIGAIIKNPLLLVNLFFNPEKLIFYLYIFGSFGYLSFASPSHFVLFLAPLLPQVITSAGKVSMLDHAAHYQAHTLPFIIISAIYGCGYALGLMDRKLATSTHRQHVLFLSLSIIISALLFYGKSDGHRLAKSLRSAKEREVLTILSYLKAIPADASVCAVNRLMPHLSDRKYLYMWERSNEIRNNAQYVVLYERLLEADDMQFSSIINKLQNKGYKAVVADIDRGFFILKRPAQLI